MLMEYDIGKSLEKIVDGIVELIFLTQNPTNCFSFWIPKLSQPNTPLEQE